MVRWRAFPTRQVTAGGDADHGDSGGCGAKCLILERTLLSQSQQDLLLNCSGGFGRRITIKSELPSMAIGMDVGEADMWGSTSSMLGLLSLRCLFDIQRQMWNRELEFKGGVWARDRSCGGRHCHGDG